MTEEYPNEQSDRCVTLLSAAFSSAPAVPAVVPVARAAPPELNIHPEEEVETWDQVKPVVGSDIKMSESERSKAIVAEDRKFILHGVVTPGLQARMERGTAPKLVPRHRLNKDCQSCKKFPLCFEAAPGYMQQIATKACASRVEKVPIQDVKPPIPPLGLHKHATHVFQVSYLKDPTADTLPVNYGTALSRHVTLRNSFSKLTKESRDEFNERLSSGIHKGYWHLAMGEEL